MITKRQGLKEGMKKRIKRPGTIAFAWERGLLFLRCKGFFMSIINKPDQICAVW
jgi:hypothetical protein